MKEGNRMRPIKDLLFEDYWEIAYRRAAGERIVGAKGVAEFRFLPATARYWYADPFLFEYAGKTYLFVEMFDNRIERGAIGCAVWEDGHFTAPAVVLEESFHLSYPLVFERDGTVYMMPETREDGCIQLYRAVEFPTRWEKDRVLVKIKDAVDTVMHGDVLLTSIVTDPPRMMTRLERYDLTSGAALPGNPVTPENQISRGAGRIFTQDGATLRPAQNCTDAVYGAGLIFYRIEEDGAGYRETEVSRFAPAQIGGSRRRVRGVHTYACTQTLEVVDCKKRRFNLRRLIWIFLKKR